MAGKVHLVLEFASADPHRAGAFEMAGLGKIPEAALAEVGTHQSVVYLHFPADIQAERARLVKFTKLLQELGGYAFSLSEDAPNWRLKLEHDGRHEADEPFFNPHGAWVLSAAP